MHSQLDTLKARKFIGLEHNFIDHYNAITQDQNGYLYLGGVWGPGLVRFDGYEFKYYVPNPEESNAISNQGIRYLYTDSKGMIWVSTQEGLNQFDPITETFKVLLHEEDNNETLASNMAEPILEHAGYLWVGSVSGLSKYNYKTKSFSTFYVDSTQVRGPNFIIRIIKHLEDPDLLWIGTNQGLYLFSISKEEFEKIPEIEESIFGIHHDPNGNLYISPGGYVHLIVFNLVSKSKENISLDRPKKFHAQHLVSHTYDCISFSNTELLISSSTGLAKFNKINKDLKFIATSNTDNDLPYKERVRIFFTDYNGYLWMPSYTGLAKSEEIIFPNKQRAPAHQVRLNTIEVGDDYKINDGLNSGEPLNFKSHEKTLKFIFSLPNPNSIEETVYAYRVNGGDWVEQKDHSIYLDKLKGRSYSLELKALDGTKDWTPISRYNFTVDSNFWETWWFKSLMAFTLVGLILSFYFIRMSHIRKEEQLKASFQKQLAEVEMSALRAQMNPHFLFNTMNSINHYILKNEPDEASDYLTKFSRLVRQILNNSKSKTVSLNDELSALQLYVEMEQLRFENKFEFEVFVEEDINRAQIKLPPLLIQPYIENAIWHGLMHKEESGKIELSIGQDNGVLQISIKDNGIGREKAKEYKSSYGKKKESYGMQITKHRVDLVNQIYNIHTDIEINDLHDNNEPIGTEVVLSIPIIK